MDSPSIPNAHAPGPAPASTPARPPPPSRARVPSGLRVFLPLYILEFCKIIGMGVSGTAVGNLLLLEYPHYPTWVAGLVAGADSLGFMLFVLAFGNLAERLERRTALRGLLAGSLGTAVARFVPLTSPSALVVFGLVHFVEGGLAGLFWPVVQSYSLVAEKGGERPRDAFIAGYNAGWNGGLIASYLLGFAFVFVWGTNYTAFWVNLAVAVLGVVLATVLLVGDREIAARLRGGASPAGASDAVSSATSPTPATSPPPDQSAARSGTASSPASRFLLPILLVFALLLVHSFADGSLKILGPLKVDQLALSSASTYLLMFAKASAQTVTSIWGARASPRWTGRLLAWCPVGIGIAWVGFGLAGTLPVAMLAIAGSGIFQGLIYAAGMKQITIHATAATSSRYFGHYQVTMGFGRMAGPFLMGFVSALGFLWGVGTLVAFAGAMALAAAILAHYRARRSFLSTDPSSRPM